MRHHDSALLRRLIVSGCLLGLGAPRHALAAAAQGGAGRGRRERQVMERFLAVLERAPRRGTALDRVYGYHVERGTLDALIKTYQDRTAQRPERRRRLAPARPGRGPARPRRGGRGGVPQGRGRAGRTTPCPPITWARPSSSSASPTPPPRRSSAP